MTAHTAIAKDTKEAAYLGNELSLEQMLDLICFDTPIEDQKIRDAMESNPDFPLLSQMANFYISKGWSEGSKAQDLKKWLQGQIDLMEEEMAQTYA